MVLSLLLICSVGMQVVLPREHHGVEAAKTHPEPAEKLPYDSLLGHVTQLLSEVRLALRD
jgi:hypothetical protein